MAKRLLLGFALLVCSSLAVSAQTAAPASSAPAAVDPARITKLEQQVADAKGSADNAWMLTSAALEAVKQWRFKPHYEGGKAVPTETRVTVNFTIFTQ